MASPEHAWLFLGLPDCTWGWLRCHNRPALTKESTGHATLPDAIANAEQHGFHRQSEKYAVLSDGRTTYFHPGRAPGPLRTQVCEALRLFTRVEAGVWRCIHAGEMVGPSGRTIRVLEGSTFRSGQTYMDFDVAKWLEKRFGNPGMHGKTSARYSLFFRCLLCEAIAPVASTANCSECGSDHGTIVGYGRINVDKPEDALNWAEFFGVSDAELRSAVQAVGDSASKVHQYLGPHLHFLGV